jgi:CBS domain containing-hemolysin-like protein
MTGGEIAGRLFGCAVLLAFSALFSGMTLGVMGLDTNQLEIVRESGTAKDRAFAAKIIPVRRNGNLLLVTLLFGNVGVNSLMSILLADLTSGLIGFFVSTILIVMLGEVIPQAACSRNALRLGSLFVPMVQVRLGAAAAAVAAAVGVRFCGRRCPHRKMVRVVPPPPPLPPPPPRW